MKIYIYHKNQCDPKRCTALKMGMIYKRRDQRRQGCQD
ncbi:MAG TPA: hypothetical protein EYP08_00660 [Pyrodictiaceae archaeon]|nr:hypothetical protein [Pyrodictiaceae archaeon]